MIYEYALEPEMVATWGGLHSQPHFKRAFGLGQGRIVSRYPKRWAKMVWDSFIGESEMDKKRLEELLVRIMETMVKRKDCCWDDTKKSWLENALQEHERYPFFAIMARKNLEARPEILAESDLADDSDKKWDVPHGCIVPRKALDINAAIETMLSRCRWVKFIDPRILSDRDYYWQSLEAFLSILGNDRPLGPPEQIEIHALFEKGDATTDYLQRKFKLIIPSGQTVTLYRWIEKPGGHDFHNRYILTDIGGVSLQHGLDAGAAGQIDDINRLEREQYEYHCSNYDFKSTTFDLAETPTQIIGTK